MMLNKLGAMSYPDDQTKIVRNLANVAYRLKVHEQVWDDRGFVVPKALRYPDTHIFHHKHISHFPTRYDSWPR